MGGSGGINSALLDRRCSVRSADFSPPHFVQQPLARGEIDSAPRPKHEVCHCWDSVLGISLVFLLVRPHPGSLPRERGRRAAPSSYSAGFVAILGRSCPFVVESSNIRVICVIRGLIVWSALTPALSPGRGGGARRRSPFPQNAFSSVARWISIGCIAKGNLGHHPRGTSPRVPPAPG